ncbi:MAG: copper homeostasis protein CutC [Eubacteriales bacterium]|nr:copper homeostasis protein CutC [Eubacteriales bacterium]
MNPYLLEVCVDSTESALEAAAGGADRLELCSNLIIGGTTPSAALFREIRSMTDIRIHALIRPRFGDFCYTNHEFHIMLEEVKQFAALGAEGIVIGILKPDGNLDLERMRLLIEAAGDMSVTLHRAFDVCRNPQAALHEAIDLGIRTILTSGQENSCLSGRALLDRLVKEAAGRIDILAGAGINASVIRTLAESTGVRSFHMSGKTVLDSSMVYRRQNVNMGLPSLSEYEIWRTDREEIKKARRVLDELSSL